MIFLSIALTLFTLVQSARLGRQRARNVLLAAENVALRKQRETALEMLRQVENYSTSLEREKMQVRAAIGARHGERTLEALRKALGGGKEVWS